MCAEQAGALPLVRRTFVLDEEVIRRVGVVVVGGGVDTVHDDLECGRRRSIDVGEL